MKAVLFPFSNQKMQIEHKIPHEIKSIYRKIIQEIEKNMPFVGDFNGEEKIYWISLSSQKHSNINDHKYFIQKKQEIKSKKSND